MSPGATAQVFFFYGLAFFCLGMAVALELGRGGERRLHRAFSLLAIFGLIHGAHEWVEMFRRLGISPTGIDNWQVLRVAILAISFLALSGFGVALWHQAGSPARAWLFIPLAQAAAWAIGLILMERQFGQGLELWTAADAWTRYVLAIPGALLAATGLVALRRLFRAGGMAQFGRDSLTAALAFAFYGLIGQVFTVQSRLPPSDSLHAGLFMQLFGFPVELLRTLAAIVVAVFVIRLMRSFQVERQRQLSQLQEEQLLEAERRQALRGEWLNRVVQAQEAERQRIARELHDETGQALTAIGLGLRGVSARVGSQPAKEAVGQLAHLESLTNLALNELQRLIAGLRPSHLDDLGLPAALRWYGGEVEDRAPITVRVEIEGEERALPAAITIGLFRVAQEALTNVVKHASAELATLRLSYGAQRVELDVIDDGVGFDTPGADRPSWGLIGIQERVSLMGGEFELDSERGKGTRIRVAVPAAAESEVDDVGAVAAG